MKAILVILRTVITLLIVILLVVNLALMLSASIDNGKPPQVAGSYLVEVEGSDMEPTLQPKDVVIARKQPQYEMGEVVAYIKSGALQVHRIVGTNSSGFITQGDAAAETDDTLLVTSEILGEAVVYLPQFGPIMGWLMTPICTVVLVLAWFLMILLPVRLERRMTVTAA